MKRLPTLLAVPADIVRQFRDRSGLAPLWAVPAALLFGLWAAEGSSSAQGRLRPPAGAGGSPTAEPAPGSTSVTVPLGGAAAPGAASTAAPPSRGGTPPVTPVTPPGGAKT